MRQLVLRWTMWFSLFAFACLTTGGTWRYLSPPAAKVPLESLVRTPPRAEKIPERDAMLLVSRVDHGGPYDRYPSMLWPTRLPPGAVLSESGQEANVLALAWTVEGDRPERPLLRLRRAYDRRLQLPDLPEVVVRGQVGRAGQVSGDICPTQLFSAATCTYSGLWWLEKGKTFKLTSSSLSTAELIDIAESLEPLVPAGPIPYQRKTVARGGYAIALAGNDSDFPVPSVTYLADIKVYLVRTLAGYGAYYERDERYLNRQVFWDAGRGYFAQAGEPVIVSVFGRCHTYPCSDFLSRYAVRVESGKVLVDLGTRYTDTWPQRLRPVMPEWAQAWP